LIHILAQILKYSIALFYLSSFSCCILPIWYVKVCVGHCWYNVTVTHSPKYHLLHGLHEYPSMAAIVYLIWLVSWVKYDYIIIWKWHFSTITRWKKVRSKIKVKEGKMENRKRLRKHERRKQFQELNVGQNKTIMVVMQFHAKVVKICCHCVVSLFLYLKK
jgi:hypothetical protein